MADYSDLQVNDRVVLRCGVIAPITHISEGTHRPLYCEFLDESWKRDGRNLEEERECPMDIVAIHAPELLATGNWTIGDLTVKHIISDITKADGSTFDLQAFMDRIERVLSVALTGDLKGMVTDWSLHVKNIRRKLEAQNAITSSDLERVTNYLEDAVLLTQRKFEYFDKIEELEKTLATVRSEVDVKERLVANLQEAIQDIHAQRNEELKRQYVIGDFTQREVFERNNIANLSDLSKVFSAVEEAFERYEKIISDANTREPRPVRWDSPWYFDYLIDKAHCEAHNAMHEYPQPNYTLLKLAEEQGEVIKAFIHFREDRALWSDVEGEIIQSLAMLIRLLVEGDKVNGIRPPTGEMASRQPIPSPEVEIHMAPEEIDWVIQEYKVWKGLDPDKPQWSSINLVGTYANMSELVTYLEGNAPEKIFRVHKRTI